MWCEIALKVVNVIEEIRSFKPSTLALDVAYRAKIKNECYLHSRGIGLMNPVITHEGAQKESQTQLTINYSHFIIA